MPELDISETAIGNLKNTGTEVSVDAVSTDAAGDQKETKWINTRWRIQLGYYKSIPDLKKAIDAKATWTIGKGFTSNEVTEMLLMSIKGHGKDTFNTILENQKRTADIGGDSFAEIIRDGDEVLVNLKPLDPSVMMIVMNRQGLIIRYEQISKCKGKDGRKLPNKRFKPEQIFHLSRNRTADEIHGESLIDAVEDDILAVKEAKADMRQLMHRYVRPRIVFKLDTDNDVKIAAFKVKADKASDQGENLFIPKDAVEWELLSVPTNATLNPLPWIQMLNANFWQAVGVPQIVVGGSMEMTEATAKIAYLAFEQTIGEDQLYIEEQVLSQLNLEIELEFPASLENDMISDKEKSETTQASTPEDTAVKDEGVKPQEGVE